MAYKLRNTPVFDAWQFTGKDNENWQDFKEFCERSGIMILPGDGENVLITDGEDNCWVTEGEYVVTRNGRFHETLFEYWFNQTYEYEGE